MLLSNVANIMERQLPSPLFHSAPETLELKVTWWQQQQLGRVGNQWGGTVISGVGAGGTLGPCPLTRCPDPWAASVQNSLLHVHQKCHTQKNPCEYFYCGKNYSHAT